MPEGVSKCLPVFPATSQHTLAEKGSTVPQIDRVSMGPRVGQIRVKAKLGHHALGALGSSSTNQSLLTLPRKYVYSSSACLCQQGLSPDLQSVTWILPSLLTGLWASTFTLYNPFPTYQPDYLFKNTDLSDLFMPPFCLAALKDWCS